MSSKTPNIDLEKQEGTEIADVEIMNANLDKIDEEIGKRGKTVNGVVPDASGNYQVNEVPFARQIVTDDAQQSSGEYLFRTTGGEASLSDGDAKLVKIFGRSVHTGVQQESIVLTVSAVQRETGVEPITAEIDRDTFVAYVLSSGTITLSYTDAWSANPTLYGVTVHGVPVSGDVITIVYVKENRGLITNSMPTKFISTGWNLYKHSATYARVKKYSDSYGFIVGGTYTSLKFSETVSGTKTNIIPSGGWFNIPSDGYVWVSGGNSTNTYILMTWSDWENGYTGDWEAYTESSVNFASVTSSAFPYGMIQVGGVADEIDFGLGKAISRIERMSYTEQNLAYVISTGREYDCDTNYIYVVRDNEVVTDISVSGDVVANDHGLEIVEGGTVAPFIQTIYGENLVDKLRTDVVTKSSDIVNTLTSTATNKALSANMGKTLNEGKAETIYITNSDNTWAKIWAKISAIRAPYPVSVSVQATPASILTDGAIANWCIGTIAYSSTTNGYFDMALFEIQTSSKAIHVGRITGATASSAGTYTEMALSNDWVDSRPRYISLVTADNTWEKIWAKVNTLKNYEPAPFYAVANSFKIWNREARNNSITGVITRTSSASFTIVGRYGASDNGMLAMYFQNVSASSEGDYSEKEALVSSDVNYPEGSTLTISSHAGYGFITSSTKAIYCYFPLYRVLPSGSITVNSITSINVRGHLGYVDNLSASSVDVGENSDYTVSANRVNGGRVLSIVITKKESALENAVNNMPISCTITCNVTVGAT